MNTVTKDHILGKAWEAQLAMLAAGKKCWAESMKRWLLKHQPQEVAGSLPPVQPSLEMVPRPIVTHALQVRTAQSSLEMAHGATHIHPTRLVWVRGRAESQMLCNMHNVEVGVRMAKLATLQLAQPVDVRSTT
jgi:hypothetical protein